MKINLTKLRSKNNYLIIGIIALFTMAAMHNLLTYLCIGVFAMLFLLMNIKCVTTKDVLIPKLVVILLLFQNFSIGIGAHIGGNMSGTLSLLTQVPFMFICVAYFIVLTRTFEKLSKIDILFFVYIVLCIFFFFLGDGGMMAKLVYFRNFTVFYMGFFVGKYYLSTKERREDFFNFFINVSIIAAVFGMVGLVLGRPFYFLIGVPEVYEAKQYLAFRDGIPGNFMTLFMGKWVNRQAGLYYDPVNFSYYMALACIMAFALKRKKVFIFFLICEAMTFGKGGFMILGLSVCYVVAQKIFQKLFSKVDIKILHKIIVACAIFGIVGLSVFIHIFYKDDFGTYNHFYGIITGVEATIDSPLGNGLGTAGNLIKTADVRSQAISETGLVNMAYQIGVFGTILFGCILTSTSKGILECYRKKRENKYLIFAFLPIVILIVSLFQENTFTPQCIIPYMIMQGAISNERKENSHEENRNCNTVS